MYVRVYACAHVWLGAGVGVVCACGAVRVASVVPRASGWQVPVFSGGCTELGRPRVATAVPLTIATWAPCGQIFWFQGPEQLDFVVKRWDF